MIDERKIELMTRLVDAYISTGQPVGSSVLVRRYRLSWSSATIRNEMAVLEEQGYMHRLFPSSGRVPTPSAYQFYLEHSKPAYASVRSASQLRRCGKTLASYDDARQLCGVLAGCSDEIAFCKGPWGVAVAGLRTMADKPECADQFFIADITTALDCLEDILARCDTECGGEPIVIVGDNRTFGRTVSAIIAEFSLQKKSSSTQVGILGPLRMNYQKNIALIQSLTSHLYD